MGMEFTVSSLEEMCDLMCDNKIPKKRSMKNSSRKTKKTKEILEKDEWIKNEKED